MRTTQRRWLRVTVATLGAGALTFGGAVLPAAADDSTDESVQLFSASADKFELAAAHYEGSSALGYDVNASELESDGNIHVSEKGFIRYIEEAQHAPAEDFGNEGEEPTSSGAPIPGNPVDGSRPGAPVTVYLDFDGEVVEGKHWNDATEERPAIETLDFAPANAVSDQEAVWAAVAEDYAPFNVNVTTTRPSDDALYKTSADDNEYGSHVIITDSYDETLPEAAGSGGIAWLGGTGSEYLSGALVFTNNTDGDPKVVAEIASHESGHNFGLGHDGIEGEEYYAPQNGLWAPIMGAGYYVPVTHWSIGDYAGASNDEDDLSIITDREAGGAIYLGATLPNGEPYTGTQVCVGSGDPQNPQPGDVFYAVIDGECADELTLLFDYTDRADYAADEVGNTADDAQALDNSDGSFEFKSVIETTDDVDVFALTTIGGEITADVSVADISPNLDAKLTLTNEAGDVVAEDNPDAARVSPSEASGLNASVTADVDAGTYYLSVEGVGFGDPSTATPEAANAYSEYGSLGNYELTGTADPFVVEPIVITSPEDGAEVEAGATVEVTGTAEPGAEVTLTVGGTVVDTVTADEDGNWTGTVTANDSGETAIVAAQSVDGTPIAETATVTVVVPAAPLDAPVITGPANEATLDSNPVTIAGTGEAGATVTVTVNGPDGEVFSGEAVVSDEGSWWIDVEPDLANGDYTVVAVQALDGVTSDPSDTVAFTVAVPSGNGGGGDDDDDNLATTGSDFDLAPFAAMAGVLLIAGGALAVYARRKSLTQDS